ncbi:MAG TPA: two-component system response regulator, partial [Eubacterium sp.]|nr:two-component system response regulator [Eubacterium sp.]
INISGIQFKDSLFEKNVEALFEQHRIDPSKIEFEITESVFMGDSKSVIELLERLRTLGIKISIDDFGTGYSSLAYLKNIPIDTLKIDKSFIDSVITEETTSIITTGIIDIVKKLGYEIIAEGVETAEQFDFLKSINCDNIQGYLLGHPMRYDDVCELLKGNSKF